MLQNKIYQNYLIDIFKTLITILFSLTIIAWTVRAVNFLDLIVENGYPLITYFKYSILNVFGILPKFIPLSFLLALIVFILKQIQENELVILWTSGVKKTQLVKLFFIFSLFITVLNLIFSVFITPLALNKSRQLLSNEDFTSFLPTIKVQQFSDSFEGVTFIVDKKIDNEIENIFLQDSANILKNISSNKVKNSSNTIIANSGLVEDKRLILFNGKIISSDSENKENDIFKFEQLNIDLNNFSNRTIKTSKIQETPTFQLVSCIFKKIFPKTECKNNFRKEIIPTLNRRIILPFYIPVITLIASFLLIKPKKNIFFNKISIFTYCFLILLYAELIIRYTGVNKLAGNLFLFSPIILSLFFYNLLTIKFSKELISNE
jgi:lipopolysaccharide export system permease protein